MLGFILETFGPEPDRGDRPARSLVFFLSRLTGDPAYLYLPLDSSEAQRQAFFAAHGFNDPLYVQFGRYLLERHKARFRRGDEPQSAGDGSGARSLSPDAEAGGYRHRPVALSCDRRRLAGGGATGQSRSIRWRAPPRWPAPALRDFWVAIVAILVFAVGLGRLPTSGTGTPLHWIMPIFVLTLRPFGLLVQVVRGTMISALSSAYVKTARAKGVKRSRIIFTPCAAQLAAAGHHRCR